MLVPQTLTQQELLNGIANSMIANSDVWLPYKQIGRSVEGVERNLRLLRYLFATFPYYNQEDPSADIEKAQIILNQTLI